jgi:fumarate reductase subunit C
MAEEMSKRNPYVREITSEWIFRHPRYVRYLVREFSCLFIGAWTVMAVVGLGRLAEGQAAWEGFLAALRSPASVAFHLVALCFATYHSLTWFNLTPKALPVQVGEEFLPDWVIAGAHYAAWAIVSVALLFFAGGF